MISESPSKTTSCSPSSMEKEIAFLQARASTSSTVDGRVMRSDRAAITIPSESLITTPMPPMPVSWKSLHHYWLCTELVGEVTGVLGGPPFFAAMGCLGLIGIHGSVQWHQYRSSPKAPWLLPLSVHSYYARYPKQCMQISLPNVVISMLGFLDTNHGNIPIFQPKMVDTASAPTKHFLPLCNPRERGLYHLSHNSSGHKESLLWCSSLLGSVLLVENHLLLAKERVGFYLAGLVTKYPTKTASCLLCLKGPALSLLLLLKGADMQIWWSNIHSSLLSKWACLQHGWNLGVNWEWQ